MNGPELLGRTASSASSDAIRKSAMEKAETNQSSAVEQCIFLRNLAPLFSRNPHFRKTDMEAIGHKADRHNK